MPPDVREYVIRRSIRPALDQAKTADEKQKLSAIFLAQAHSGLVGAALMNELIAAAFKVLDGVPDRPLPKAPPLSQRYPALVTGDAPNSCGKCGGRVVLMHLPRGAHSCCDVCGNIEEAGS